MGLNGNWRLQSFLWEKEIWVTGAEDHKQKKTRIGIGICTKNSLRKMRFDLCWKMVLL